ncbi:MAG: type II toxin-antitoxin system RelE/ParE family toxin [Bacteroidota bacterium]
MKYTVVLQKRVIKTLEKIKDPDYSKLKAAMFSLGENPRPKGYKRLRGRDGYRIRVGNYRIIYEIFDKILLVDVINLGHRKEIYN